MIDFKNTAVLDISQFVEGIDKLVHQGLLFQALRHVALAFGKPVCARWFYIQATHKPCATPDDTQRATHVMVDRLFRDIDVPPFVRRSLMEVLCTPAEERFAGLPLCFFADIDARTTPERQAYDRFAFFTSTEPQT